MSIYNRKAALRNFIVCIVICLALIAGILFVTISKYLGTNDLFSDPVFAQQIASSLGVNARDITQETLDQYESIVYYCDIQMTSDYKSYTQYPVILLGNKDYTDKLLAGTDPADDADDTDESAAEDEPKDYIACIYVIQDVSDLSLFRNLRYLSAFDASSLYNMSLSAYYTQMYGNAYGFTGTDVNTITKAMGLADLTSLSQLASLNKLEVLAVEYSGLESLEGIENFPSLRDLDISSTQVTSLAGVEKLQKLETIFAAGREISDLTPLAGIKTLKTLDIENNKISDLTPLAGLTSLEKLSIANNEFENCNALKDLTNLTILTLSENEKLTDISGIKNSVLLETLYIDGTGVSDISALSGFDKLKTLEASDGKITDISALSGCKALTSLTMTKNTIVDVTPLSACTELTTLDLSENKITDITAFKTLTKATSINVSKNEVTTFVEGVTGLNSLTTLTLSNNKITSIKGIDNCWDAKTFKATVDLSGNEGLVNDTADAAGTKVDVATKYNLATFTGLPAYSAVKDPVGDNSSIDTESQTGTSSTDASTAN